MVLLIHHWGLLIFGIMKTSDLFQQWFYGSSIVKDKDLTPQHTPTHSIWFLFAFSGSKGRQVRGKNIVPRKPRFGYTHALGAFLYRRGFAALLRLGFWHGRNQGAKRGVD